MALGRFKGYKYYGPFLSGRVIKRLWESNLLVFLLLLSCSKISYVSEQAIGQLSLQWNGESISDVLEDVDVSDKKKDRIRKIQEYKVFFYNYFNKKPSRIYSKFTQLDQRAVTYLVIASNYNEVKPLETSFPFVGSFPYLGFFKKDSALSYAKEKRSELFHTYLRPVYAYSTLGYFEDRILSSFFEYNEFDMAEMIFHELFHTVFFVKDNVDLNENLANFFGTQIAYRYFAFEKERISQIKKEEQNYLEIKKEVVRLIKNYNDNLKKSKISDYAKANDFLDGFLVNKYKPKILKKCKELKIKKCPFLEGEWNHARFAALMTYEKEQNFIEDLYNKKEKNLINLFSFLEKSYEDFKSSKKQLTFTEFLKNEASLLYK